ATGLIQKRSFDGLNQLRQLNSNGTLSQYQYDALGRRSAKITEAGKTDFIWDGNQLIGEHTNGEYTWYIYLPDSFLPVALIKGDEIYYYHLDQLGTPICLTDSHEQIVWQNNGDLFGAENGEQLKSKSENLIDNPLRFQGQYYDAESGLHYNRFRYYCPKQGRFIHQDPIGLAGGINPYQYAPNPVNWVDPFGLSCKEGEENEPSITNEGPLDRVGKGLKAFMISSGAFLTHLASSTSYAIQGRANKIVNIVKLPVDAIDRAAFRDAQQILGDVGIELPNTTTLAQRDPTVIAAAKAAKGVYDDDITAPFNGYSELSSQQSVDLLGLPDESYLLDEKIGFKSKVFYNSETDDYMVAFRGSRDLSTAINRKQDWVQTNVKQGIGLETDQYNATMNLAKTIAEENPDANITYVGHSKGGGQAAAAAIVGNRPAITFNAAGVHKNTITRFDDSLSIASDDKIRAYYVPGEALNTSQDHFVGPQANGQRIRLELPSNSQNRGVTKTVNRHFMDSVNEALGL
ncbi:RHS repeat domain-containing protein, partial [Psychromonas antarctica]|uniref:RHS repeat domain-containing protein n=1 Tax=Psychromonas antarctica TaxID=67573 RepID=UPI001EE8F080